jgi:hypothetical protein
MLHEIAPSPPLEHEGVVWAATFGGPSINPAVMIADEQMMTQRFRFIESSD